MSRVLSLLALSGLAHAFLVPQPLSRPAPGLLSSSAPLTCQPVSLSGPRLGLRFGPEAERLVGRGAEGLMMMAKAADDKPKRPLSAYFRFTAEMRPKLKASEPNLGNKEIVSKMGAMWRELSDAQKKPYQDAATKELEEYNKKFGKEAKPKKPLSAYMMYCNAVREQVVKENPSAKFGEISKIIGGKWREMGAADKKKWKDKEEAAKKAAA